MGYRSGNKTIKRQGDINKPKEDFEVQYIGLSDNDSFEEIICEVVNWF